MEFNIVNSKLFLAIVVCALSIVSSKDYSSYNDTSHGHHHASRSLEFMVNRGVRNSLTNLQFRRSAGSSKITHKSHHSVQVHVITTGGLNQNFEKKGDQLVINVLSRERPASVQYVEPTQYYKIVPVYLVPNLRTSGRFRDNVVFILGYILQLPKRGFTSEQYLSLEIIYNAIKRRQVHMYSLLPVLDRIQNKPKISQFRNVMVALSLNLPAYLACAAKFIVSQIDEGLFDSNIIFAQSTETLEFLADINTKDIELGKKYSSKDELIAYDTASLITEVTLGRLFVKLFKSLSDHTLYISQPLFACILRNLPNPDGDPIFNEYIRFIAELAWDKKIPNWTTKKYTPPAGKSVHDLINTITDRICSDVEVSYDIKRAVWYIRDHFVKSAENIVSQSVHEAHLITREGIDVNLLISLITPEEYNPHVIRLKYQLIQYMSSNSIVIQSVLAGMNRYGYSSPQQLLLAFLTRLRTRLPVEHIEIRKIVSSLHSILIVKRQVWNISPSSQGGMTFWTLLETINNSETDPKMLQFVQIIFEEILQKVITWGYIENIGVPSKSECYTAKVCLRTMLIKIITILPPKTLTTTTYESINKLIVMINVDRNVTQEPEVTYPDWPGTTTQYPQVSVASTEDQLHINYTGTTSKFPSVSEHLTTRRPSTSSSTRKTTAGMDMNGYPTTYRPYTTTISTIAKGTDVPIYSTSHKPHTMSPPEINPTHQPVTRYTTTQQPHTPTKISPTSQPVPEHTTHEIYKPTVTVTTSEKPSVTVGTTAHQLHTISSIEIRPTSWPVTERTTTITSSHPPVTRYTTTQQPHIPTKISSTSQPVPEHTTTHEIYKPTVTVTTSEKPSVTVGTTAHQLHTISSTEIRPTSWPVTERTSTVPSTHPPVTRYTTTRQPHTPTKISPTSQPVSEHTATHEIYRSPTTEITSKKPSINVDTSTYQPHTISSPAIGPTSQPVTERTTTITSTHPLVSGYTTTQQPHISTKISPTSQPVTEHTTTHQPKTNTPPRKTLTNRPGTDHTNPHQPYTFITTTTSKPTSELPAMTGKPTYDHKVSYNVTVIPETIKPNLSIHVDVSESGVVVIKTSEKPDAVNLPSLLCLQEKPSEFNMNGKCDEDLVQMTQPLVKIFGKNYIEVILGTDWQIRYPTRISLLIALFKNVEKNPKFTMETNLVTTFRKYKVACQFITSYVFLPLLVSYNKLTTEVVWSTYDSENPSNSNIGSDRPMGLGSNVIAIPLPNPQTWLLPVDVHYPFSTFFPPLPKNDAYTIQLQPLKSLFESESIYQLLGKSWNPAQYPSRGVLFVSVLHILLKHQAIKTNPQLYELVRNYVHAIEGPSTSVSIPQTFIIKSSHTYHTIWTIKKTAEQTPTISKTINGSTITHTYTIITYRDIGMFPRSVQPGSSIHLTVSKFGTAKIISPTFSGSTDTVSLPSIICLQKKLSANYPNDECAKDLISITQSLIKLFGEHYIEVILGKDWTEHYPTTLSFLVSLLEKAQKNPKIAGQTELIQIIERYNSALRFVASYILLPLLADYKGLKGLVVWSTFNTKDVSTSHIGQDRPEESAVDVISLPIVNPVILRLPVNRNDPFSMVIPNLSLDDAHAVKFQNFVTLFKSGKVRELLGSSWSPSQYSNNGDLLISVLHILLTLETVKSNTELYHFIHDYVNAVELPTIYGQISHDYIEKVAHRGGVSFTFEGSHDMIQLPPGNYSWQEKNVIETVQVTNVTTIQAHRWSKTYIETITKTILNVKGPFPPPFVIPGMSIHVDISELGIISVVSPEVPAAVVLPSFDCLQNKPQPDDTEDRCQKDLKTVRRPLIEIFGTRYIEVLLGRDWQERYPTRISFLVALLTNVEGNPKIRTQKQLLQMIRSYKIACEFVASYVMLPMIIDSQNLDTVVVWSVYDSANPSSSYFTSIRPNGLGNNVVVLPLVNPILWRLQVDTNHPFDLMLPELDPEDHYYTAKLKPLRSLLQTGKINELLGDRWKPSQYPNRGALFISVMRKLLETTDAESDRHLYNLLYQYMMAFEIPALYNHISHTYIKTIFDKYHVNWVKERYFEKIKIPSTIHLPPKIHPKKTLQVIIPENGSPIVESVVSLKKRSKIATILPSVECLQGPWTSEEDANNDDQCDSILEFRLTQPLIDVFGDDYGKEILGNDWSSHYPTRISFLAGLLRSAVKNQKVISHPKLLKLVQTYKEALEIAAPYIFLPWLSMYQQLNTTIVWLTFNANHSWHSHMARNAPQKSAEDEAITLPIMNPKIWLMPVNIDHPFSGFLPDLPPNNTYEEKIAPLRSLLKLHKLRDLTGRIWDPSQYPNRGMFFVSVMHTLLKLGPTRLKPRYNEIVLHYYMAIEIPALYVHIPRSYITKSIRQARGRWGVDLVDLMFALPEAKTEAEIRLWSILEVWLMNANLLKQLKISLPSLTISKGSLLLTIFETALSSTSIQLSAEIKLALQTFKSRILTTGAGVGAISWVWISTQPTEYTHVVLEDVFSKAIQMVGMSSEVRYRYGKLVEYFATNPTKLTTEGFPITRYHTYGSFLRAYLYYLTQKPDISEDARANINAVISYVIYTGPGATPMPQPTTIPVS